MNLTSPSQVKAWCIANGFHPNRTLGQNFLIDHNALDAILDAAAPAPGANILEVGPGLGVLTEGLLARGARVTAVEKDPVLAARLAAALGNPAGLKVVAGDALELAAAGALDGFDALVSNLPYSVGTRIMLELAGRPAAPAAITVLVQTEVAERLAAGPGSKVRGLAGVLVQLDYDVRPVRAIKAACFWPRPEVGSTVVRLDRHAASPLTPAERAVFRDVARRAFEHRRKQLGAIFKGLVESSARAEELSNADWISLAKGLAPHENA